MWDDQTFMLQPVHLLMHHGLSGAATALTTTACFGNFLSSDNTVLFWFWLFASDWLGWFCFDNLQITDLQFCMMLLKLWWWSWWLLLSNRLSRWHCNCDDIRLYFFFLNIFSVAFYIRSRQPTPPQIQDLAFIDKGNHHSLALIYIRLEKCSMCAHKIKDWLHKARLG